MVLELLYHLPCPFFLMSLPLPPSFPFYLFLFYSDEDEARVYVKLIL